MSLKKSMRELRKKFDPIVRWYHKVSRLKNPELYFLTFVQLCVLWRSEADLKVNPEIYKERCKDLQNFVSDNIKKRELFSNIECKDLRLLIKNNQEKSEIIMVFPSSM